MPRLQVMPLFFGEMNSGIGEVGQSSGVIGIAVCQHDVMHIIRRPSQRLHSANCGVGLIELKSRDVDQLLPETFDRIVYVEQSDSAINQHEAVIDFEQQTMTNDGGITCHDQRAAVDVMNSSQSVCSRTVDR